jgi:hypothetical protein
MKLKALLGAGIVTKLLAGAATAAAVGSIAVVAASHSNQTHSAGPLASASVVASDSASSSSADSSSVSAPASDATSSGSLSMSPSESTPPSGGQGSGSGSTGHAPNPSLMGLCNAWLARPHQHGKADQSAAFRQLIGAAGGVDNVSAFCATLLNRPTPSSTPSTATSHHHGKPTAPPGKPTGTTHGHKPTAPPGKPTGTTHGHKPTAPPGKPSHTD